MLCARDAKFAVECDTCKMPYCLVCLASGTKDPCVRCGQRPSKRVEQLVHLRLKSIYKAFKQSGAALSGKGGENNQHSSGDSRRSDSSDTEEPSRNRQGDNHATDSSTRDMPTWMAKKTSDSSSVSMPLPASVQRYAEMHGKESKKHTGNGHGRQSELKGNVGVTLEVNAAMTASMPMASSTDCNSRSKRGQDFFPDYSRMNEDDSIHEHYGNFKTKRSTNHSEQFAAKTQAEADAAAAALLAELDEEKLQHEANSKAKKNKKKKKKQRQAAKEKEKEQNRLKSEESKMYPEVESKQVEVPDRNQNQKQKSSKSNQAEKKKETQEMHPLVGIDNEISRNKRSPQTDETNDSEDDDITLLTDKMNVVAKSKNDTEVDEIEKNLADLVSQSDLDGIEKLLAKMKGVPGRAALRKNAKKAVKRIKEERISSALKQEQRSSNIDISHSIDAGNFGQDNDGTVPYRAPEPLLKVVSKNNRVTTPGQTPRYECVMHMAPSVVGWVIGKGGQRIRDLMEESGAKVWIDQDSMGPNDMRVVYVSGNKKSIELAVTMVKDLVAKAPVGGTTHGHNVPVPTSVHSTNDASSVTSTRSSLTSTPVSLVQNFSQQVPIMAEKPSFSPVKKPEQIREETTVLHPANDTLPPKPLVSPIPDFGSTEPQLDMPPPPGILSDMNLVLIPNSNPCPIKTNKSQLSEAPRAVHELTCEPRFVALLIGRRGWTVKQIQDTSGARVDIDQTVNPRRIIVSGDVDQVQHAVNLVRGVLSYPHAKQHYSATNGVDESDSDNIIGASTSASEDFLAGISGPVHTHNNPFTAMPISNENQTLSHNKRIDPSLLESNLNHFGNHQLETMQHQQFNSGIGIETPYGSNGQSHSSQMNVPPPTGYSGDDLALSSMQSDPRIYMQRHHINPVVQVENQHFTSREFFNNQIPTNNLQYETILPLSGSVLTQGNQMNSVGSHYQSFENHRTEISTAVGQRTPSHNLGEQSSFGQRNDFSTLPSVEQDAVNSLFGSKDEDSLINSLNNFSFLDFLQNDNIEKPPEQRNFGLGGVRLDSSSDNNPLSNESLPSLQHKDQKPIWGP